jgi:hypothetical protein
MDFLAFHARPRRPAQHQRSHDPSSRPPRRHHPRSTVQRSGHRLFVRPERYASTALVTSSAHCFATLLTIGATGRRSGFPVGPARAGWGTSPTGPAGADLLGKRPSALPEPHPTGRWQRRCDPVWADSRICPAAASSDGPVMATSPRSVPEAGMSHPRRTPSRTGTSGSCRTSICPRVRGHPALVGFEPTAVVRVGLSDRLQEQR